MANAAAAQLPVSAVPAGPTTAETSTHAADAVVPPTPTETSQSGHRRLDPRFDTVTRKTTNDASNAVHRASQ